MKTPRSASASLSWLSPVTIPFELVMRHVVVPVTVKGRTLSFVPDTGDKTAIIDLERATQLGLALGSPIRVGGVGAESVNGAMVRDTSFSIAGVPSFPQPVTLAIPLKGLASKLGHDFDGIIGHDFIRQFVVEIGLRHAVRGAKAAILCANRLPEGMSCARDSWLRCRLSR